MRCAAVIDRPDQIHAMLQGQRAVRGRPASARQRRQTLTERRIQPLDIRRVDDPLTLRAPPERLDACRRAIDRAACGLPTTRRRSLALDDLGDQDIAPWTPSQGPSTRARVHGIAKGLPNGPDVGPSHQYRLFSKVVDDICHWASLVRSVVGINGLSRSSLTALPSHHQVQTIIAKGPASRQYLSVTFCPGEFHGLTLAPGRAVARREAPSSPGPWAPNRAHPATTRSSYLSKRCATNSRERRIARRVNTTFLHSPPILD